VDNLKKKVIIVIAAAILLLALFTPIKSSVNDGGTTVYSAILYKVIIWHQIDYHIPGGFKTGTEIHFFPNNFHDLEYYTK